MEIWKDVKDYEGLYQVSNLGRVKSLSRTDSKGRFRKEKVLKLGNNGNGYIQISLCKNGVVKRTSVHRLVAYAFVPKTKGFDIVNHIDENPSNNRANNLEWCTQQYNTNYCTARYRAEKTRNENKAKKPKKVINHDKRILTIDEMIEKHKEAMKICEEIETICSNYLKNVS